MEKQNTPVLGMILKGYPRISETFIANEILLLESAGFNIHIFSMREPREAFSHDAVDDIQAEVTYLPSSLLTGLPKFIQPNLRAWRAYSGRYWKTLRMVLKKIRRTGHMSHLRHFLQAGNIVAELAGGCNIQHFHAHFAHSPTSVARYAHLICGAPYSFTAHAKDIYTTNPKRLQERIEAARFVVTCTDYNRRHLQALAPDGKEIHMVYHGIDVKLFSNENPPIQAMPPYTILTVTRFVEKKGIPTVLQALRLLRDGDVEFTYVLVGPEKDEPELNALIEALALGNVTILPGKMKHSQVLAYYRSADLFVLGCQIAENGDRDGIPNVLVESMAMGVPVLATHISGIPELVQDGENGSLVPPEEPELMADAMQRLLTDVELRARLIPAARRTVEEHFDNTRLISELVEVFVEQGVPHATQPDQSKLGMTVPQNLFLAEAVD